MKKWALCRAARSRPGSCGRSRIVGGRLERMAERRVWAGRLGRNQSRCCWRSMRLDCSPPIPKLGLGPTKRPVQVAKTRRFRMGPSHTTIYADPRAKTRCAARPGLAGGPRADLSARTGNLACLQPRPCRDCAGRIYSGAPEAGPPGVSWRWRRLRVEFGQNSKQVTQVTEPAPLPNAPPRRDLLADRRANP
jgi:hypothetical protein